MTIQLVPFKSGIYDELYINPAEVRFIYSGPDDQTVIVFPGNHEIWVAEPIAETRRKLTEAA